MSKNASVAGRRCHDAARPSGTQRVRDSDPEVRAYYLGKLMRQAKPDDVFTFVTLAEVTALFPLVTRYLGRRRDFWTWLLGCWKALPSATQ